MLNKPSNYHTSRKDDVRIEHNLSQVGDLLSYSSDSLTLMSGIFNVRKAWHTVMEWQFSHKWILLHSLTGLLLCSIVCSGTTRIYISQKENVNIYTFFILLIIFKTALMCEITMQADMCLATSGSTPQVHATQSRVDTNGWRLKVKSNRPCLKKVFSTSILHNSFSAPCQRFF